MYIIKRRVMKLREIKIIILGTGINDSYQACITIYDSCGNIVYEGLTYNGYTCVRLNTCCGYCMIIKGCGFIKREVFFVDAHTPCYSFNSIKPEEQEISNVTFQLTDFNYSNLPIMKGEIILWQKQ